VRLTTAEYMTPSGRTIHGKGITPDVVIEDADTADPSAAEAVLARAVAILKERSRSWPTRE
jgi:carboxyl-terminal processing protease